MKKILKIIGVSLLMAVVLLTITPFAFQDKIQVMVERMINQNLHAKVSFSKVGLSFFKSFPRAHVSVKDLVVTNLDPFQGETLVSAKNIHLTIALKELFKNTDNNPMIVETIGINEAFIHLKTDLSETTNYDITRQKQTNQELPHGNGLAFDIKDYSITNSTFIYHDETTNSNFSITNFNHSGQGIFSDGTSELETKSDGLISISTDSMAYLKNTAVKLNARIRLDLNNNTYTFKRNKGSINGLPLTFQGQLKLLDDSQVIDIQFENPESDFKTFLELIPKTYSKDIAKLETTGHFKVTGAIKGTLSSETIPKLDIRMTSNNASLKYQDLPKRIDNIYIDTEIKNTTGKADDTYIAIKQLDFKIDEAAFKSSASFENITNTILVTADIDGILDLANITKVYPLAFTNSLSGVLRAKLHTSFDMNAIETSAYQRIEHKGHASITDGVYTSETTPNPIHLAHAKLTFSPEAITLSQLSATTGESDIDMTGTLKNLFGFVLNNQPLKGTFHMNSNIIKVADFITSTDEIAPETQNKEPLKIPAFFDGTLHAKVASLKYDHLNLKSLSGTLIIKDQQAQLQNIRSHIFEGALGLDGVISTKTSPTSFRLNLDAQNLDIAQSFDGLALFRSIAPIGKLIEGSLNSKLEVSGDLDDSLAPKLSSLSGNVLAQLLGAEIKTSDEALFNNLQNNLNFIDFDKLQLQDLNTQMSFNNGDVQVAPFNLKYEDIDITVSGNHSFEKAINYRALFKIPIKYLGNDTSNLIDWTHFEDAKNATIPVTAIIGGSTSNPEVQTDLLEALKTKSHQLIELKKKKLLTQGKNQVKAIIGSLIGENNTDTDTVAHQTKPTTRALKNALGHLLKKKKKDTLK